MWFKTKSNHLSLRFFLELPFLALALFFKLKSAAKIGLRRTVCAFQLFGQQQWGHIQRRGNLVCRGLAKAQAELVGVVQCGEAAKLCHPVQRQNIVPGNGKGGISWISPFASLLFPIPLNSYAQSGLEPIICPIGIIFFIPMIECHRGLLGLLSMDVSPQNQNWPFPSNPSFPLGSLHRPLDPPQS